MTANPDPASPDGAYCLSPIGRLASDYPDKFGVPRQPGLAPTARAILYLESQFDDPLAVQGLEAFSHLWLTFVFDRSPQRWSPRVRPPRLGGNRRIGVFASRSTHRPNRLGQSLVELVEIEISPRPTIAHCPIAGSTLVEHSSCVKLHLRGHDLCDATPILDIKPYLPWAEAKPDARAGFAPEPPALKTVKFSQNAATALATHRDGEALKHLISEVLAQDPRPSYHSKTDKTPANATHDTTHDTIQNDSQAQPSREYGVSLRDVNVRFRAVEQEGFTTLIVETIQPRDR